MTVMNLNQQFIFCLTLSVMIPGIHCMSFWEKLGNAFDASNQWIQNAYNKVSNFINDTANKVAQFANSAYAFAKKQYFKLSDYVQERWHDSVAWIRDYYWGRDKIKDYHVVRELYSLVEPWQLPRNTKFPDLQNITNCHCPRIFMPVCGVDNVTYVNACIMNCWKIQQRREGACIIYRRSGGELIDVAFPEEWKNETHLSQN